MTDLLTIIFDTRENSISFDVAFNGKRWQEHNDSAEGCRFASGIKDTARRHGFYRVAHARAFVADRIEGNHTSIIEAFKRQGFYVAVRGITPEMLAEITEQQLAA